MFRPLSLWQQIPCPALEARGSCSITHCLFSHNPPSSTPSALVSLTPTPVSADPQAQEKPKSTGKAVGIDESPLPPPGDPRLRRIIEAKFGNNDNDEESKRENKRRKLSDDEDSVSSSSTGGVSLVNSLAPANNRTKTKVETAGSAAAGPRSILKKNVTATQKKPLPASQATRTSSKTTVSRKIGKTSPPSATSVSKPSTPIASPHVVQGTAAAPTKPDKPLTLNPRLVPFSPAGHALRLQLLTLLHKEYIRLHEGKGDPQEMLRLALDEEEIIAREKRVIYSQSMKKRIVNLQKTSVADYQKEQGERRKQIAREEERKSTITIRGIIVDNGMDNSKPPLITGLSPGEELLALRSLLQPWGALGKYGYILEPPTVEEVKVAEKGMEAAGGWECCDRCSTRFQVFDGRRESDGKLASGGQCVYHWGRAAWPLRTHSVVSSDTDKVFTCCRQKVGQSPGCVTCENHVYKVSEAKRLAAIWRFIETPNPQPSMTETEKAEEKKPIERAICLDCEMCFTTLGMELIRITATAFPSGEVVVDALVRPKGEILDLNSRFSGIFPKHIVNAQPHSRSPYPPTPTSSDSFINPSSSTPSGDAAEESLTILSSPETARSLLLSYIDSETPIVGHALENDLNALRLCHRTIVDTAILFPHQRGLPLRNKLKWLVEKHLKRKIQVDGDFPQGHDSKIDARCAGELVRSAIKEEAARRKRFESRSITNVTRIQELKRKGGDCGQGADADEGSGGVRLKA